jgi:hypothetical protein
VAITQPLPTNRREHDYPLHGVSASAGEP